MPSYIVPSTFVLTGVFLQRRRQKGDKLADLFTAEQRVVMLRPQDLTLGSAIEDKLLSFEIS